jgi:hypothetical protein
MPNPNRDLGPCSVIWDPAGDNLELNPTFGGVTFRDEVLDEDIHEDQAGLTIVDGVHTGRIVEVTIPMTRSSLAQLQVAIKGSTAGASNLKVKNWVGGNQFPLSKELRIKPIVDNVPSGTPAEWLHILRAYPKSNLEWQYNNADQRVTNVVFKAFPDDESGQVRHMWRMGAA